MERNSFGVSREVKPAKVHRRGRHDKLVCRNCRKACKEPSTCGCSSPNLWKIGYDLRVPKKNASNAEWNRFWRFAETYYGYMLKACNPEKAKERGIG